MRFDVLLALSGGIDSCVAARLCQEEGQRCAALHVDSGKPSSRAELAAAQAFCDRWKIPLETLTLRPSQSIAWSAAPDEFFGPYTLLALCACLAISIEASSVAMGLTAEQVERLCADPRWPHVRAAVSGTQLLAVQFPLRSLSKRAICLLAPRLGVPPESTWSCTTSSESPCGACDACRERMTIRGEIDATRV